MSRYLVLFLFCLPFIVLGIVSEIVNYKLGKSTKKRMLGAISAWLITLMGLAFASPLYEWLFVSELTESEPLSLFDVVAIVAVVTLLYIVRRTRTKLDDVVERNRTLHEELSIYISQTQSKN